MPAAELLHDERIDELPHECDQHDLARATSALYVVDVQLRYEYAQPVHALRQRLVVLPRARHGDQRRVARRVIATGGEGVKVRQGTDGLGNVVVEVDASRVERSILFRSQAVVARSRRFGSGVVHPWVTETTPLTEPDAALHDVAASVGGTDVVDVAERLAGVVRSGFHYRFDVTDVSTSAADAWALGAGLCQDMAHVMIAMCHSRGIPARYVSGHMVGEGGSHAWVEVLDTRRSAVVAIDPTHERFTDLRYITTAVGRDYCDVAPTSGTYDAPVECGRLHATKRLRLVSSR